MDIHPIDGSEVLGIVSALEPALHRFAFGEGIAADFQLPEEQLSVRLPKDFQPLMADPVLSVLTTKFGFASDEGPFEVAMTTGRTIFAIYLCIYPPYFPQIGPRIGCGVSSADPFN